MAMKPYGGAYKNLALISYRSMAGRCAVNALIQVRILVGERQILSYYAVVCADIC